LKASACDDTILPLQLQGEVAEGRRGFSEARGGAYLPITTAEFDEIAIALTKRW